MASANPIFTPSQIQQTQLSDYVKSIWISGMGSSTLYMGQTISFQWELHRQLPTNIDPTLSVFAYAAPTYGSSVCGKTPPNSKGYLVIPNLRVTPETGLMANRPAPLPEIPMQYVCFYAVLDLKSIGNGIVVSDAPNKESGPAYNVRNFCHTEHCDVNRRGGEDVQICDPTAHQCVCKDRKSVGATCDFYEVGSPSYKLVLNKGCRIHNIDVYQSTNQNRCICRDAWIGDDCGACSLSTECTGSNCRSCSFGVPDSSCSRCICQPHYGGEFCEFRTSYFTINTSGTIAVSNIGTSTIDRMKFITDVRLALSLDLNIHIRHVIIQKVRRSSVFIEISLGGLTDFLIPTVDPPSDSYLFYRQHPTLTDIFETIPKYSTQQEWIDSAADMVVTTLNLEGFSKLSSRGVQILKQQLDTWVTPPLPPSSSSLSLSSPMMDNSSHSLSTEMAASSSSSTPVFMVQQQAETAAYLRVANSIRGIFESSETNSRQYNIFTVQQLIDANIFSNNRAITPVTPLYFRNCAGTGCSVLGPDPYGSSSGNTMLVLIIVVVIVVLMIVASVASILYCRKKKLCCYKAIEKRNQRKRSRSTTGTGRRSASTTEGDSQSDSAGSGSGSGSGQGSGSGSGGSNRSGGSGSGAENRTTASNSSSNELAQPNRPTSSGASTGSGPRRSDTRRNTPARNSMMGLAGSTDLEMTVNTRRLPSSPPARPSMISGQSGDTRALPPGWKTATDNTGRTYYVNTQTLTSSWVHPMDEEGSDEDDEVNIVEE